MTKGRRASRDGFNCLNARLTLAQIDSRRASQRISFAEEPPQDSTEGRVWLLFSTIDCSFIIKISFSIRKLAPVPRQAATISLQFVATRRECDSAEAATSWLSSIRAVSGGETMGRIQSAGIALIADDDEYFRMALSTILRQKLGFAKVHEVSSFDEALECLETAGTIKLSIFDLSMPGIDSPLMLRTIRESFDVERLAVVSASERRSDIIASLEAGAHGFVSKSQGVNELSSALKKIYDGLIYVPQRLADLSPGMEEEAEPWDPPSAASDSQLPHLTPRQRDVLELLVEGRSNKEIARMLDLGPGTIKVHLAALFRNLGVSNRAAAAVAGARLLERLPNGHEPGRLPRTA